MSESARMWMEIVFNVAYLSVVWTLVIAMWRDRHQVSPCDGPISRLFFSAFLLLVLGDSGHLGFRLWAYALGDIEAHVGLFGLELGLVGLGALATAVTVTLFYVLVQIIWQRRFQKPYGWLGMVLFGTVLVRFALMIPDANQWHAAVPPQPWSIYRNLPLMVQGLGIAYLILRDASASQDKIFRWIGLLILASYTFYMPVIFFVQKLPVLGMLMIPKTIAYVAIAFIGYFHFFRQDGVAFRPRGLNPA
jgi:hypothetical protein